MKTLVPELFDIETPDSWKKYLDENGYVVIQDVLSKEKQITYFKMFAKDWKQVSPNFDFHNEETWTPSNSPIMWNKGIAYWNGFGQSDFMWALRLDNRILSIWKKLHNTDNLVVSFDAFSVYLSNTQKSKSWLHVDQNNNCDIFSVQGAYNFLPVTENSSGFIVVPKSHKTYTENLKSKSNFCQIDEFDKHRELAVKLLIPSNCFILWNSKTIHANVGISDIKLKKNFNRLTCYLSYFPKALRPDNIFNKRINGYVNKDTCGHFAIRYNKKNHPYGVKKTYDARNFNFIEDKNIDNIPKEIYNLI
jgi:ectoine hydroxylase-related dioxygenase (phytanoyl-CoA dioxygenase family)